MNPDDPSNQLDIVVANYNNGRYLKQLVETVLTQTCPHWNLIIVDDASTDNSLEILQRVTHPRIKVIRHDTNKGAASAFRTGIKEGNSPLITILGADDGLTKLFAEKVIKAHKDNQRSALIYFQSYQCDSELKIEGLYPHTRPLLTDLPIFDQLYSICNPITFKRDFYLRTNGMSKTLRKAVDHDLILKLSEVGDIKFIPEPIYLYRIHGGGISQGNQANLAPLYSLLAKIHAFHRRQQPKHLRGRYDQWTKKYHTNCILQKHSPQNHSSLEHWIKLLIKHPFAALKPRIIKNLFFG